MVVGACSGIFNYKHIWHGLPLGDTNGMRFLIGENNKSIALTYRMILKKRNHKVRIVDNSEDCLKVYRRSQKLTLTTGPSMHPKPFDVVILDYNVSRRRAPCETTEDKRSAEFHHQSLSY